MTPNRKHLGRLFFPCPHCDLNVVVEALGRKRRCPHCEGTLPDIGDRGSSVLLWYLMTGKAVSRQQGLLERMWARVRTPYRASATPDRLAPQDV